MIRQILNQSRSSSQHTFHRQQRRKTLFLINILILETGRIHEQFVEIY